MEIYLVGGAVRDFVLDLKSCTDRDWVVVGSTPKQMLELGYVQVGRDFPVFLHPKTNEEYALARIERKVAPGHQGFICHSDPSVTLEQDLLRRDLTINAMAMDPENRIIDPYNGLKDCKNKVLRHVSEAFSEDPLRCLRVARFTAKLPEFQIASETLELCKKMVKNSELSTLSKPRIWQEWHKALISKNPNRFLAELYRMGIIAQEFPNLEFTKVAVSSELRFALIAASTIDFESLVKQIEPPKYAFELAKILHKHKLVAPAQDGDAWLKIFKDLDAFRRPERLYDWLQIVKASPEFKKWQHSQQQIIEIFQKVKLIKPDKIIAQGYIGQDISQKLDQIRVKLITELL